MNLKNVPVLAKRYRWLIAGVVLFLLVFVPSLRHYVMGQIDLFFQEMVLPLVMAILKLVVVIAVIWVALDHFVLKSFKKKGDKKKP